MERYLNNLRKQPAHHQKRFAFLVSGGFTLAIFTFWSLATFGAGGTLAQRTAEPVRAHAEVSPLDSLKSSMASSIEGLTETIGSFKQVFSGSFDIKADYAEMRDNVLNTYGPVRSND